MLKHTDIYLRRSLCALYMLMSSYVIVRHPYRQKTKNAWMHFT